MARIQVEPNSNRVEWTLDMARRETLLRLIDTDTAGLN